MIDSAYTIFIIFGCIWVVMGVAAVIGLLTLEQGEIRIGKWGLLVAVPIVLPFILALLYQLVRPLIVQQFFSLLGG